jgi:hypothetical protein
MRVSLANILILLGTLLVALIVSLLGMRVARWRRDVALRRHAAPQLVVPLATPPAGVRPPIQREIFPARTSPSSVRRVTPDTPLVPDRHGLVEDAEFSFVTESETSRPTQPRHRAVSDDEAEASPADGPAVFEGRKIRFVQAEEGTLEFLPGRLEIVGGEDVGQEIHFARVVGEAETTVTFGRSDGPALRHIQLLDPTVSRTHARMNFSGSRWHLTNLSHTNPVLLNGSPLPDHGAGITLEDGDRIEMGAVVFVFHAR